MGRGRLSMEPIVKEKSRRVTFQKRKKGLMKKAYEFSTLCGVDTCVIVYENPSDEPAQPETWPPDPTEIRRILDRYEDVVGKGKQPRKNYDLSEFFRDRKAKIESEITKVRREIFNLVYPTWDERLEQFGVQELRALGAFLDHKVVECEQRMKMLKEKKHRAVEEEGSSSMVIKSIDDHNYDSYAANNQMGYFLQGASQIKISSFNDVKLFEDQLVSPAFDGQFSSFLSSCTDHQNPVGCSYSQTQFPARVPYPFYPFQDFDSSQLFSVDYSCAPLQASNFVAKSRTPDKVDQIQQQLSLPSTSSSNELGPDTSITLSMSAAMENVNVMNTSNQISNQISAFNQYNLQSLQAFDLQQPIQPYMLYPPFDCSSAFPLASADAATTSAQQGIHSDNCYVFTQHPQLFNYFNEMN